MQVAKSDASVFGCCTCSTEIAFRFCVKPRKSARKQSPVCQFVPWDEGEGDTLSLTLSSGTPSSGTPSFGTHSIVWYSHILVLYPLVLRCLWFPTCNDQHLSNHIFLASWHPSRSSSPRHRRYPAHELSTYEVGVGFGPGGISGPEIVCQAGPALVFPRFPLGWGVHSLNVKGYFLTPEWVVRTVTGLGPVEGLFHHGQVFC